MPGSDIRRSAPPIVCTLLAALAACALRPQDPGSSASDTHDTTGPQTTTDTLDTTTTPGAPGPGSTPEAPPTTGAPPSSSGTGDDTTNSFIEVPDSGQGTKQCDYWIEDCPEGQKCMPFADDGDISWEGLKCVDVVPDPDAPGEPCTVVGAAGSGEDSCDKHAMCWDVHPDTGIGTCVAMCIGSPDAPACASPDTVGCWISGDGVLNLCFPQCDPLAQDCGSEELCLTWNGVVFDCAWDPGEDEGQVFGPCEIPDQCDPGLHCAEPALALECDPLAPGCCLPFCDIDAPAACPGVDQQCVPWYADPAEAATFNADLGLCRLP